MPTKDSKWYLENPNDPDFKKLYDRSKSLNDIVEWESQISIEE